MDVRLSKLCKKQPQSGLKIEPFDPVSVYTLKLNVPKGGKKTCKI